jgi:hypothetical protein
MYPMSARFGRARTKSTTGPSTLRRTAIAGVAVAAAAAGLTFAGAGIASAATVSVSDASFAWAVSGEQGGGAFAGGCNFLSAGTAGNTTSSRAWTQADGFYSTQSGNVTVEKPNAGGAYAQPTWATKCQDPNGAAVSPGSTTSLTGNRVVFGNGTGSVDVAAHTASIHWTGSFTSVFYGGLTYWSAANPTLTVNADGSGTLTATASGYGADMTDASQWNTIAPTTITLANLHGVSVTSTGFTVTPDYLGVSVTTPTGSTAQSASNAGNAAYWGAFPQSYVDFQQQTGQSSYWFSSGGSRDAAKVVRPLAVSFTTAVAPANSAPAISTQPAAASVTVGGTATFTAAASGSPSATVQWQLQAPGSPSWQNYPGATNATFALNVPALGYSGSKVRAVFTNSEGTATTAEVGLTVTPIANPDGTQSITATVPEQAGAFSWTIDASDHTVTLTNAADKGSYLQSTGSLKPVKITDTRAGAPAWSVSGQVGNFTGGLSGKYLGWTPSVVSAGAGATAGTPVASGIDTGNGLADSAVLGQATAGHAKGTGSVGADLDLRVPVTTAPGTYSTTLTLTVLS